MYADITRYMQNICWYYPIYAKYMLIVPNVCKIYADITLCMQNICWYYPMYAKYMLILPDVCKIYADIAANLIETFKECTGYYFFHWEPWNKG